MKAIFFKKLIVLACLGLIAPLHAMERAPKSSLTPQQKELFQAIDSGNEQIVDKYIANKGDLNIVDKNQWTPLLNSIIAGKITIALKLLNAGANPNTYDKNGTPLLNSAVFYSRKNKGYSILIKALLNKGADVTAVDASGNTPLHEAAASASPEVVKLLLDNDANI